MNTLFKRVLCIFVMLALLVALIPLLSLKSSAATVLPSDLYLSQQENYTCTLCSATMMLRSCMYLGGNSGWSSITESSMRSTAWVEGEGLRWSFTYSHNDCSMTVSHSSVSGISVSSLKSILDNHPEGIVLYCGYVPHAVFLTDYDGDTFYCADTVAGYSGSEISLASSYLGKMYGSQSAILNNVTAYWYISSASIVADTSTERTYSSCCTIEVSSTTTYIKSLPYSTASDSNSINVEVASKGDQYRAIELVQNKYGNLWYKVETKSGTTGYMYAGDTTFVSVLKDLTATGITHPANHPVGTPYSIQGVIQTDYSEIISVGAYITDSTSVLTGTPELAVSTQCYSLPGSALDSAILFDELSTGTYTYSVKASARIYYAQSATELATTDYEKIFHRENFSVVSSTDCSHTYSASETLSTCTDGGYTTYTCTKCGSSYISDYTEPDGHQWGGWGTETEATCTTDGLRSNTCHSCLEEEFEVIPATGHSYGNWITVTETGCTTDGVQKKTCSRCGDVQTQTITANGHTYQATTIPATCQDYEKMCYTCSGCGDSYEEYSYTDWTEAMPDGIAAELIESKTQYSYSDYETVTSYDSVLDGYVLLSSAWEATNTGTIQYVKNWPAGFSTSHSLYTSYNNTAKTALETEYEKTTVESEQISGYLYFHWCRGTYTAGPINRDCTEEKTSEFTAFHAFYSTTDPSSLSSASDGSREYSNSSCCTDTYWYFYVPVYSQTYTIYSKLYTHERWSDWSEWSDTAYTADSNRQVQTRTLYRYVNTKLSNHLWDDGTVEIAPTCELPGLKVYTCMECGEENVEHLPIMDHIWESVVINPSCIENGSVTVACSECGEVMSTEALVATGHSYVDGICTACGQELVDAELTIIQSAIAPESYIGAQYIVNTTAGAKYDKVYIIAECNGVETILDKNIGEAYGMYGYEMALQSVQMADVYNLTVYGEKDGETYKGGTIEAWSVKAAATEMLNSKVYEGNTTKEQAEAATLANMLDYGAKAQLAFSYNTENLANAGMAEAHAALITTDVTLSDVNSAAANGTGATLLTAAMGLESIVQLQIIYEFAADVDASTCYAEIVYNGNTVRIESDEFVAEYGVYAIVFDKLAAYDVRTMIEVTVYDGTGAAISDTLSLSLEGTGYGMLNGNYADVVKALMAYGDAANALVALG